MITFGEVYDLEYAKVFKAGIDEPRSIEFGRPMYYDASTIIDRGVVRIPVKLDNKMYIVATGKHAHSVRRNQRNVEITITTDSELYCKIISAGGDKPLRR